MTYTVSSGTLNLTLLLTTTRSSAAVEEPRDALRQLK